MTRFELRVDEIVVGSDPRLSTSSDLGGLVEERLARLARGGEPTAARWVTDEASLADLVADRIWAEVRGAADLRGATS
jgi:hypothetical protein